MKIIKKTKFSKILRNFVGYKPSLCVINSNKNLSTSDAFFWRTDNNFKTIFKFTDIFNLYFKDKNSTVEILFYDKKNKFLKKFKLSDLNLSNKLIIDKSFMNDLEDYGSFYIFHESSNNQKVIIRNSCYTGYSKNNLHPSYVHGNTITASKNYHNERLELGIAGKTYLKNNIYQIQNCFQNSNVELMIINPTKAKLKISVNDKTFNLESCCSIKKNFNNINIIKIISKCYLLRPIIFSYHNNYLDVYHG